MVAQPVSDFLTEAFVTRANEALMKLGFVTDEHSFAPYRETMNEHVGAIADALARAGHSRRLGAGYVEHRQAGYAYFIYDEERFDARQAQEAVRRWLDEQYRQ